MQLFSRRNDRRAARLRRGATKLRSVGIGLLVLLGGALTVWYWMPGVSRSAASIAPLLYTVERGEFVHDITERGELESANNVEIRCEVKSMGLSGTTILEIIPEGTLVKPGDILAKLDSSSLENDRMRQQIAVATAEADVIKARTAFQTAQVALKEYLDGVFKQNLELTEGEVYQAEENLRKAKEYYAYSQILANKGYITEAQLKADSFAAQKGEKDLAAAKLKREVLTQFTRERMTKQLEADIEATEAKFKAQQHAYELELAKLADIETQLEKCVIRAPCVGQVVYANQSNVYSGQNVVIEAGVAVRERQEIFRLPDHTQMQVRAKISESKVSMVAEGMAATIRLDALPDLELAGTVERVNEYPLPTNRYTSSAKEYEAFVRILDPPKGARPGLTAEVHIHVEHQANVLQTPLQAVLEHGEHHFVAIFGEEGFTAHEVKLGSSNDKTVVVREGLTEGQEIVLNAGACRSKLDLPDLTPEKPTPVTVAKNRVKSKKPEKAASGGLTEDRHESTNVRFALSDPNVTATIERLLSEFDDDKDEKLEIAKLPSNLVSRLRAGDANADGKLDRAELEALLKKISGQAREKKNGRTTKGPNP